MQRWILAGALLLAMSASNAAAQTSGECHAHRSSRMRVKRTWSANGDIVAGSRIATRMSSCIEAVACCTLRQRLLV